MHAVRAGEGADIRGAAMSRTSRDPLLGGSGRSGGRGHVAHTNRVPWTQDGIGTVNVSRISSL